MEHSVSALPFNPENQLATQRRTCQHLLAGVYFQVGFIEINTVFKCLCHSIFEYLSGIYCSMYFMVFKKDEKSKSSIQLPHEKRGFLKENDRRAHPRGQWRPLKESSNDKAPTFGHQQSTSKYSVNSKLGSGGHIPDST